MRKKHRGHGFAVLLLVAALACTCAIVGCTDTGSKGIEKITGKDAAGKIERIKQKSRRALDKAGRAVRKAKDFTDRVIEKAGGTEEITKRVKKIISNFAEGRKLKSKKDIDLTALDNAGYAYRFTYGGEKFRAVYSASFDTWTIYDSYKITNDHDITLICQALIDVHPVHGADLKSYRTADDMAYEWKQHNIVYELLPDGNRYKAMAKDVDLDPYDQGRSYKEIYENRTGKKFNLKDFV